MSRLRYKITSIQFFAISIIVFVIILGLWFGKSIGLAGGAEKYPLSWFMIVSAILGSVVNQPFRQESLQEKPIGLVWSYMLWKCAISIVFAFALYMLFVGDFLSGDLFPSFSSSEVPYKGMVCFFTKVDPESNRDVAKILLWSFVAGFSEKFVPNIISQLAGNVVHADKNNS